MKLFTIKCAPGYHPSRDSRAFTAKRLMAMGINRIQRERLGRTAATTYVQTVFTDVPGSTSALSFVRRA